MNPLFLIGAAALAWYLYQQQQNATSAATPTAPGANTQQGPTAPTVQSSVIAPQTVVQTGTAVPVQTVVQSTILPQPVDTPIGTPVTAQAPAETKAIFTYEPAPPVVAPPSPDKMAALYTALIQNAQDLQGYPTGLDGGFLYSVHDGDVWDSPRQWNYSLSTLHTLIPTGWTSLWLPNLAQLWPGADNGTAISSKEYWSKAAPWLQQKWGLSGLNGLGRTSRIQTRGGWAA